MRILKRLSVVSGIVAIGLMASMVQMGGAQESKSSAQTQTQAQNQQRTNSRQSAQRRSQRSYSYLPSRGGDISGRASTPTWSRADSKAKFRYGSYPY
jgi:hypothetical protein